MAKRHLMIDIETLGVTPDAVILTIGAQGFCPYTDRYTDATYYERLNLESQDNRHLDEGTLAWWGKQSADAQEEALGDGNRLDIKDALEKLGKVIWKHDEIWVNGLSFDIPILEHAFKQCGLSVPFKYWKTSDTRTVYKLVPELGKTGNNHNALADCVNQIDLLQKAFKILGIKNPG